MEKKKNIVQIIKGDNNIQAAGDIIITKARPRIVKTPAQRCYYCDCIIFPRENSCRKCGSDKFL